MSSKQCSVIIAARNEEFTIGNCCKQLGYNYNVSEIIVVANDCHDMTVHAAKGSGSKVKVISLSAPGKGNAISVGAKYANNSVIILCDGDLKNPSPFIVSALFEKINADEAVLVKGYFDRNSHPGPVTDMLVKPILLIADHPASCIQQPLSGMIAVEKNFLCSLDLPNDYGVDLHILLSAFERNLLVREVLLPPIDHRERPWSHYQAMAEEVSMVLMRFGLIKKWGSNK